ncbi:MAG TPA: M6 family metalloprotease domain-containing protein [Paludibacter sp.]
MNKKVLLLALGTIYYQLTFLPVLAVKAYPFPITVTQPDGTQLTIRLKGDEFHHFQTTEDGYILKKNVKGYLTYAILNSSGETIESQYTARNINKRSMKEIQFLKTVSKSAGLQSAVNSMRKSKMLSIQNQPQRAFPLMGTPKSLVILVNFSDTSFVTPTPQTAFTNLLNQDGYNTNGGTGSARDYFMSSTYGKFTPTFDVVGPYILPHKMAFYGANDANDNDVNPQQMVIDACALASTNGLDFRQYDTDNDGFVDNIFIYYAGYNEAEGGPANSIWPHRWTLDNYSTKFNGKIIYDYSCTSELRGSSGSNMCGIGTFCHEFGHVLGLPDYYDTSGTQTNTLNSWSIMDEGCYNNGSRTPPTYSVYDRFFLGYITPQQVNTASNFTLLPIYQGKTQPANTNNQAFLLSSTTHNLNGSSPGPSEFFMLEYRIKTGWDTYLPAEGMCIWHIDYNQTAWDNNTPNNFTGTTQTTGSHMHVYLQPLSGSTTTPGSAFTNGSFTPTTWSGTDINRAISGITKTVNNFTFNLMAPRITTTGNFTLFSTTVGMPSVIQNIVLIGYNLMGNLQIGLLDNSNFEIKLSTENTWSRSINITPVLENLNVTLQVHYNPISAGSQTDQLLLTSTGATNINMDLSGTATLLYDPYAPAIVTGRIENLLQFTSTKLNSTSTKTLNIKTTNIVNDLSVVITGKDANMFTVSANTITKDAADGSNGINISINYKPTTTKAHTAMLTISGGGLNPEKVITLNGTGF